MKASTPCHSTQDRERIMGKGNFLLGAVYYSVVAVVWFGFGFMLGREHQCTTMNAEYKNGKCMVVQRTEVKP